MAKFVVSVGKSGDASVLGNLPDIALVGPSNAGKSSLINSLARSRIALVSNKPGKTRTLNFYDFGDHYLVDTPGYGYSEGSRTSRGRLLSILNGYFTGNRSIVGVMQVVSNHGLSAKDLEVVDYLAARFHNYVLLVNKADRLSNNGIRSLVGRMAGMTKLAEDRIIAVSAKEGMNISLVAGKIREFLG